MPSPPASGSSGMPAIDGAMNKAIEAHRAGRTSVAEIGYTSILDFDPDHSTALHLRGFVRLQQGRPGDGLDDLRKAVVRNPSNAQAWAHLAACQLALGIQALEPAARRALALTPGMADAWSALAQAAVDTGATSATVLARRALVAFPNAAAAWHRLGLARLRAGVPPSPRWFRNALLIEPADGVIWADLSQCLRRLRQAADTERAARFGYVASPMSAGLCPPILPLESMTCSPRIVASATSLPLCPPMFSDPSEDRSPMIRPD